MAEIEFGRRGSSGEGTDAIPAAAGPRRALRRTPVAGSLPSELPQCTRRLDRRHLDCRHLELLKLDLLNLELLNLGCRGLPSGSERLRPSLCSTSSVPSPFTTEPVLAECRPSRPWS